MSIKDRTLMQSRGCVNDVAQQTAVALHSSSVATTSYGKPPAGRGPAAGIVCGACQQPTPRSRQRRALQNSCGALWRLLTATPSDCIYFTPRKAQIYRYNFTVYKTVSVYLISTSLSKGSTTYPSDTCALLRHGSHTPKQQGT